MYYIMPPVSLSWALGWMLLVRPTPIALVPGQSAGLPAHQGANIRTQTPVCPAPLPGGPPPPPADTLHKLPGPAVTDPTVCKDAWDDTHGAGYCLIHQTSCRYASFVVHCRKSCNACTSAPTASPTASPTRVRFMRVSSGSCKSHGGSDVTTIAGCEAAAAAVHLSDTTAFHLTAEANRPYGCIFSHNRGSWSKDPWLMFNRQATTVAPWSKDVVQKIKCGSKDPTSFTYDCICNIPGESATMQPPVCRTH